MYLHGTGEEENAFCDIKGRSIPRESRLWLRMTYVLQLGLEGHLGAEPLTAQAPIAFYNGESMKERHVVTRAT